MSDAPAKAKGRLAIAMIPAIFQSIYLPKTIVFIMVDAANNTVASAIVSLTGRICEPTASTSRAAPNPNTADTSEATKPIRIKRSCASSSSIVALAHMRRFGREASRSRHVTVSLTP